MQQDKVISFIKITMQELIRLGEVITIKSSAESANSFKKEFKVIKLWLEFIRINTGDANLKFSDKCKKIYNIVGVMCDAYGHLEFQHLSEPNNEENKKWNLLLDTAIKEWKKTYSDSILMKLEKMLLDADTSKIPVELCDNFINNHTETKFTEKSA
jgi:hypothetical protein